jgi:phage-related protein
MIYDNTDEFNQYRVTLFRDPKTNLSPVQDYIDSLPIKEQGKIVKYIKFLKENEGVLGEPYTSHIKGKIRELRVDFARKRHRIFFFTFVGKNIVLLHAFLKKSAQTPIAEIRQAEINYYKVITNSHLYDR